MSPSLFKKPEKNYWPKTIVLGIQHVFAMFGATVLVPLLTGLNSLVALFAAGVGTLIFHFITKRKVPVFLGSSFAYIAAIILVASHYSGGAAIGTAEYQAALPYATGGIICAGALYLVLALLVKVFGAEKIRSFFPPVVVGPMIMVIGLTLAPTAVANITGGAPEELGLRWGIAFVVLATMISISVFAKGFLKVIPILISLAVGYILALILGQVDPTTMQEAAWIAAPNFFLPKFGGFAILAIAPLALVTFMEHIGDITTNGAVVGKNFIKDPGLHRTLMGDGIATMFAGFIGGPANTTYGENTGVLAITKNYDPVALRVAAVIAIILSFFAKFGGFITSIPGSVMGAISIILFGMISAIGVRTMVEEKVDLKKTRNLLIVTLMLVVGLGGVVIEIGPALQLSGMALAAIIGIVLNKILPEKSN